MVFSIQFGMNYGTFQLELRYDLGLFMTVFDNSDTIQGYGDAKNEGGESRFRRREGGVESHGGTQNRFRRSIFFAAANPDLARQALGEHLFKTC